MRVDRAVLDTGIGDQIAQSELLRDRSDLLFANCRVYRHLALLAVAMIGVAKL
jgi:hypothetical protein